MQIDEHPAVHQERVAARCGAACSAGRRAT
jgi:hypothetical protein